MILPYKNLGVTAFFVLIAWWGQFLHKGYFFSKFPGSEAGLLGKNNRRQAISLPALDLRAEPMPFKRYGCRREHSV